MHVNIFIGLELAEYLVLLKLINISSNIDLKFSKCYDSNLMPITLEQ